MLIVRFGSSGENAEIDRSATTQSFASTVIKLPPIKVLLWNCLVAPVVARRCGKRPVPLAKGLIVWVSISASCINQEDFQV